MNVLVNHCWCSDSIWGGHYDCRVIVSIDRITRGDTYYDPPDEDWKIIEEKKNINDTLRLKPEVIKWLTLNIPDKKDEKCKKGWAIGTDKYNSHSGISFNIFFHRQKDALAFIKRWSRHKKPVSYFNYFKDIRKELDLKTGKVTKSSR